MRTIATVTKDVKAVAQSIERAADAGYWEAVFQETQKLLELYAEAKGVLAHA